MQWLYLTWKEFIGSRLITSIVLFAVVIAFISVSGLAVIGMNADRYINERFATAIPPNMIKVSPVPAPQPLFGFALTRPDGTYINDSHLKKIRSFRGVKEVFPLMASQIPLQAVISIFGLRYRTDLICIGAPYSYVSNDIQTKDFRKKWVSWNAGKELPSLLPNILLDAYNDSMAIPNGLPRITEAFALNQKYEISFGKSSIKSVNGFIVEKAVVSGFTKKIASICIVIPLSVMRYYNEKFAGKAASEEYMSVFVEAKDHASFLNISKNLADMKFTVETEKTLSKEIVQLKNNIALLIRSIGFIIILLSVMAIAFCTVIATLERVEYYRILRVLGASKIFITATILVKYALLGFLGACAGVALVQWFSGAFQTTTLIPGFNVSTVLPKKDVNLMLLICSVLPALSTIPALIKLNLKSMSED